MTDELCFGQRIDPELGILEPWYTNPAMDVIKTWDLKDKVVMEWGMGASTKWWATKAKLVLGVDHNYEWFQKVSNDLNENGLIEKANIAYINTHEGDHSIHRTHYIEHWRKINELIIEGTEFNPVPKPNICVVDGIHRYECAEYSVKVLKPEILIVDNHQQDYVFMCPKLDELLEGVRMERFIQPDHSDHSGNPWATAIFYLNEKQ